MFTQSNDDFTTRHYPADAAQFFGPVITWESYILRDADKPNILGGWSDEHGWRAESLVPMQQSLYVSEGNVRFAFKFVCPHWDGERVGKGKAYLPFIEIHGRGGANDEQRPMKTDGFNYWLDVPGSELGRAGQEVKLIFMNQLDGKDARGLTEEGYWRWKGEVRGKSWAWGILAVWKLE